MRSLLELLVVVDAEHTSCRRTAQAADLRIEETRRGMPENGKGGEAAELGMLMRAEGPLILELCQAMGKKSACSASR